MADLILNLISLKSKADAAGVGTTATSATPSLCPTKSAIPGYVTNGATTVTISGTWANNQLVPAANVSVTKTVTSTATVYRNVSVGTSSASDIPASGGSSRASATVTYQQTTRTYYSDGSHTDGTWTNKSATIYGGYVSANSKGTTASGRTSTGSTSTPSGTVAGATRTGSAVTIYQAANSAVSHKLSFTAAQVSNVSNAGGTSAVPTTSDHRWYTTYTSGSEGYVTISASSITWAYGKNTTPEYSGVSFSASSSNCQYTATRNTGNEKTLGYAIVRGYYDGSYHYAIKEVRQNGGYVVYKVSVTPLTYNGTTYTTPVLTFYNGSSTSAGAGHTKLNNSQTVSYSTSWSQSKVTGVYIGENTNYSYVRYITVRANNGSALVEKYYIGGKSNVGYVPFITSFNTSGYTSGQTIYVYYYYS